MRPPITNSRASWPSSDDTAAFNLIVIAVGLGVGAYLLWVNEHTTISAWVMGLAHREIGWLHPLTHRFDLADREMAGADPAGITLRDLYGILRAIGLYVRIPAVAFMVILAAVCAACAAPSRFKRYFDLDGLLREQVKRFPVARAFVRRRLGLTRLDAAVLRPADYALTAEEWLDRFVCKTGAAFDAARATDALIAQLGATWEGPGKATPVARLLFAAFALHMGEKRDAALRLLGEASAALDDRKGEDRSGPERHLTLPEALNARVDALLADPKPFAAAAKAASGHAYTTPALMTVLNVARLRAGVLAPAQFAWLKLVDRPLWYALQSLGFESEGLGRYVHPNPRVEAAGARDHWASERAAAQPMTWPSIARALQALRQVHAERSGARTKS